MDAVRLLTQDHRSVEAIFKEFERASAKAHRTKKKLVKNMIEELSLHAQIEEQVFYPAVQEATKDQKLALQAMEEHEVVKTLLKQLEKMEPEEERFEAKVTVLMELV